MFWWVNSRQRVVSRFRSLTASESMVNVSGSILSATSRSKSSSRARQTTPMPPRPAISSSLYLPKSFWPVATLRRVGRSSRFSLLVGPSSRIDAKRNCSRGSMARAGARCQILGSNQRNKGLEGVSPPSPTVAPDAQSKHLARTERSIRALYGPPQGAKSGDRKRSNARGTATVTPRPFSPPRTE